MSIHTLTDRAMVMNLSVGIWQGQRLDKDASRKITEQSGADADAARVNKHLVPKEALKPIVTAQGAARTHFHSNTLPWKDNGDRLMTRKLFTKFIEEHERLVREFDDAVNQFLTEDYPVAIEKAAFRMGELFKADDYPPARQLRHRFYIHLDIDAVTTTDDFRVEIDAEHVERVRSQMAQAAEHRINQAMQDVWRRMGEAIGRYHERLSTPDAVFRDSLVGNVVELIDMVPGLNVLDDPHIEEVRQMISTNLGGIEPNAIRKDPELREELAGEAQAIIDKMSGFMRAFGDGSE